MKLVIQRVKNAELIVEKNQIAKINAGLVCFVGFTENDDNISYEKAVNKLCGLRIFEDEFGKMNLNVGQINGELLIIPNFTLYADSSHGFRPSFINALKPETASVCFNKFFEMTKQIYPKTFKGVFGADMQITQVNDGPITIVMEYNE